MVPAWSPVPASRRASSTVAFSCTVRSVHPPTDSEARSPPWTAAASRRAPSRLLLADSGQTPWLRPNGVSPRSPNGMRQRSQTPYSVGSSPTGGTRTGRPTVPVRVGGSAVTCSTPWRSSRTDERSRPVGSAESSRPGASPRQGPDAATRTGDRHEPAGRGHRRGGRRGRRPRGARAARAAARAGGRGRGPHPDGPRGDAPRGGLRRRRGGRRRRPGDRAGARAQARAR